MYGELLSGMHQPEALVNGAIFASVTEHGPGSGHQFTVCSIPAVYGKPTSRISRMVRYRTVIPPGEMFSPTSGAGV
jgi:hypothetical protein